MLPVEVGRVVGGKYELARLAGRGAMGEVWVAHHRTLGEDVALKLLAPLAATIEVEGLAMAAARFRFEAQLAARLSRKTRHIVKVTDHGEEEDGLAYLVMELLEGTTLEKALGSGPLAPADVSRLVAQISRALEHAHAEGVVHRDLKPGNVFLAHDEDGVLLTKLLDFGIARTMRTQRVVVPFSTCEGLIFGTPGYMSPEQACGSSLDARADLWALATVAYEGLTGALPHVGSAPEELLSSLHARRIVPIHGRNPSLPGGLAEFFDRAFAQQIERRFACAAELAVAFERAIGAHDHRSVALRPTPTLRSRRRDTLPMAFDSHHARATYASAPDRRTAYVRGAWFATCAVLLSLAVAGHSRRTSGPGPPAVAGPPPASAPPAQSATAPSATAMHKPDEREEARRMREPPPAPSARASIPKASGAPSPTQIREPELPSQAVPLPGPPLRTAPLRKPADKSAIL